MRLPAAEGEPMKLGNIPIGSFDGPHVPLMRLTNEGLLLGRGVLLAKMDEDGLCIEEDRILTLLAVAQGDEVPQPTIRAIDRASNHWRSGDKALAAIYLAQISLRRIDEEDGERLALAAALLDAGMSAKELRLKIQPRAKKYDDNQPRVPAGSGRESGRWTSGDASGNSAALVVEGRSAGDGINHVHEVPPDAIVVTKPDGSPVVDYNSPTGKLIAPPRANFQDIYAAGMRATNPVQIDAAIGHYGKFDFQRDGTTNTFYHPYVHASNYAVGVFMAGAGYSRERTIDISETFSYLYSSNYVKDKFERKYWTSRGWDDAHSGAWK
jgi:hypothetical protein